jgi:hypothetical protein
MRVKNHAETTVSQ